MNDYKNINTYSIIDCAWDDEDGVADHEWTLVYDSKCTVIIDTCFYILDYLMFHCEYVVNTLRPRQNGRHFPDDIFKCIFLKENVWILIKISIKFVPKGPINNIPALVQIMAWRRPGDKPLFEPRMVSLLMHICVTRPQWVKQLFHLHMK